MEKRKFAERLKELRLEAKLTLVELSLKTGLSKSSLSAWENSTSDISSDNLIVLANFFKISTDYLLGLED